MDAPHAPERDPAPAGGEVVDVLLQRLDPELPVPGYARAGDAGADLRARHDVLLPPGGRASVATGMAIALPEGFAAFVHPRSGLAARHGVTTLNGPGTVDAGYRGEVLVTLVNTDLVRPFAVRRGDRVAQLVVQRVARAAFDVVEALPTSERGRGGHGSTGGWSAGGPQVGSAQAGPAQAGLAQAGPAQAGPAQAGAGAPADPVVPHRAPPSATVGTDEAVPRTATGTGGPRAAVDRRTETAGGAGAPGEEQP